MIRRYSRGLFQQNRSNSVIAVMSNSDARRGYCGSRPSLAPPVLDERRRFAAALRGRSQRIRARTRALRLLRLRRERPRCRRTAEQRDELATLGRAIVAPVTA